MARFLFASIPASGHVNPTLPIVHALTERGHAVAYVTGPNLQETVAPLVAAFYATGPDANPEWLRENMPDLVRGGSIRQTDYLIRRLAFPFAAVTAGDLLDAIAAFRPDALVFDSLTHSANIAADRTGLPWATTMVVPGMLSGKDAHPYGYALPYPTGRVRRALGRVRKSASFTALRWYDRGFNAIRAEFGLPPIRDSFRAGALSPYLILALTPPEFEYPRESWPPALHFTGPALWDRPQDYAAPDWLEALPAGSPLIYATIGTVQSLYQPSFYAALFDAARGQDWDVVVTCNVPLPESLTPPANVRVERYVPNSVIAPKADVVVHHGGMSSAVGTLAYGKPAVVVPFAHDQPENAQRVRWLGAGTIVRRDALSGDALRQAIAATLGSTEMRANAAALARKLETYDAGATGAALLERLAATKAPVLRDDAADD